jgi:heptosyltransferase-2
MHLATLLGVPVVAIFGSTEPRLTGPLGSGHDIMRHQVECSPCFLRECPIDFRCMKAISVDEVVAAVSAQLDRWENPRSSVSTDALEN